MASQEREIEALREQVRLLTQRLYAVEQQLGMEPAIPPAPPPATEPLPAGPALGTDITSPPVPSLPPHAAPLASQDQARAAETLENRIGSRWLNRIGIVAMLVGISYFLKYAFENNWIGPGTRVAIGIVSGIALGLWSESFRKRGFAGFAHSLKAVAAGALYLSLWASFQLYSLISAVAAFFAMLGVTAAISLLALRQNAEVLVGLALVGGFMTPVLVSTGENHEAALFSYILLLDAAALLLQRFRNWPRALFGSFIGTQLLFVFWYSKFYSNDQFALTVVFQSAFFALFASAPMLAAAFPAKEAARIRLSTSVILPLLNGFAYFCVIYAMLGRQARDVDVRAAQYLLAMSAVYAGLGLALERRRQDAPAAESMVSAGAGSEDTRLLPLVHLGLAVACLTGALGLWLSGHWIALCWLIEAAALFYAGTRTARPPVRWFGVIVATLAICNLLIESFRWRTQTLVVNERFGLYLLAAACLGAMLWWQRSAGTPIMPANRHGAVSTLGKLMERSWMSAFAVVVINLLVLLALNFEVGDYFSRELAFVRSVYGGASPALLARQARSLAIVRDFTYSAVWMAYGVLLMWIGFWRRAGFLRWQAIVLIGATIVKVFVFDVSALERGYRIVAFIILGVILLAISFAYQKNWLGLQRGTDA